MFQKLHFLFNGLPVAMYHSISREQNNLSINPDLFDQHCRAIKDGGWQTISLKQAEDYFMRQVPLPKKAVWLTFDDGYLDNLIYAWPILAKHGLNGTIFLVLDKVERTEAIRPSLNDVWQNKISESELPPVNQPMIEHELGFAERHTLFLNWHEVRMLRESGVIDFAPHSLSHDNVFNGPDFNGFIMPGTRGRTFDRVRGDIPWGLPRFNEKPALGTRAWYPSAELIDQVKSVVPQNKKEAFTFFQNPKNIELLSELVSKIPTESLGAYENSEQMQKRFALEMQTCQTIMQKELNEPSATFSWPWGAFNQDSVKAAQAAGFSLFITTGTGANMPGQPATVNRFNIKQRNAKQLSSRFKLLRCNLVAGLYALLKFRGKF